MTRALLPLLFAACCASSASEVRDEANAWRTGINAVAEGTTVAGEDVAAYCESPIAVVETCSRLIDLHEGLRAAIRSARKAADVYEDVAEGTDARLLGQVRRAAEEAVERVEALLRELEAKVEAARGSG